MNLGWARLNWSYSHIPRNASIRFLFLSFPISNSVKNKPSIMQIGHPNVNQQLRLKHKAMPPRPLWLINEDELEEKFIKGGGPGGQKINKCNSKVQLTHKPTGLVVDSQYSRSQEKNRAKARELLALKLEQMQNPEKCRLNVIAERKKAKKRNRTKKAAKKYANSMPDTNENEEMKFLDIEEEVDQLVSR